VIRPRAWCLVPFVLRTYPNPPGCLGGLDGFGTIDGQAG
jgi:hypothetical protein